jgi:hypothetical protein
MAFREVGVHEIREVLRLWVRGEGPRSIERLSGLDRKTVRRYVTAAQSCGALRDGGEGRWAMRCCQGFEQPGGDQATSATKARR